MTPKSKKPPGPPAMPPPLEFDNIDLGAALPSSGPPPKRGRGRPKSATGPKPRERKDPARKLRKDAGKSRPKVVEVPYIDINNIMGDDIENITDPESQRSQNLKERLTLKELKFITIYFTGEYTTIEAMKTAGYEASNDNYLYTLAKKIIERYETQAGDHKVIARAMGAGEVLVFKSLLSLIKSTNERIKLDATINLAKILGLQKEQIETARGITIIFEGDKQALPAAIAIDSDPALYAAPQRILQITK